MSSDERLTQHVPYMGLLTMQDRNASSESCPLMSISHSMYLALS